MAKFRESGYVNDFVMFRNACEERKLKYTLSHIDKMKLSYNRQQDKEKLFFAVQHLSVPAEASLLRSRSNSAPLQKDGVVEGTINDVVPKNKALLTKRRNLTLSSLEQQQKNEDINEEAKTTTLYNTETKTSNPKRSQTLLNDSKISSSPKHPSSSSSTMDLPQVVGKLPRSHQGYSINTQVQRNRTKQRGLMSPTSEGGLLPFGSNVSERSSSISTSTSTSTSIYDTVYSDTSSESGSVIRPRFKEKQKDKDILKELIKQKKTIQASSPAADQQKNKKFERMKRTTASCGLASLPAKEEWQRRLNAIKGTNQNLTRREKQAIEERVHDQWKDAFDNMKAKRLSIYQSKMSTGEESNKTFVKFLSKSKQAFYIKDVQFAQKFL